MTILYGPYTQKFEAHGIPYRELSTIMMRKIKIQVHHQLEAIQQMTVFAGGMLMLGLNILMFGTLFLLIRVIQRMNKFEKVNKCNHKVLKQSIFFQIVRLSRDPWPERSLYKTSNSSLVYGKSAATSRIHGSKRQ